MGSRAVGRARIAGRIVLAGALCASGAALAAALREGLYANALLAVLVACWVAAASMSEAPARVAPEPPNLRDLAQDEELRRLRFMLDHAPVPLVALRADGTLHAVNRPARALFLTDDVIAFDDVQGGQLANDLGRAMTSDRPDQRMLVRLAPRRRGNGPAEMRSYALSLASITGAHETIRLAALVDIQSEIQQAEASALRELLQTLSHEIMNTLTPVISLSATAASLLEPGGNLTQAREAIATVARRTAGLDRFVEGYRALARVPSPVRRPTQMGLLLADSARLFEARWSADGVVLRLTAPRPDIRADLDPDLVSQALLALLANGAQAALAHAMAPWVALSVGLENGQPWLLVEDSGAGVPADQAAAIFRPLYTTRVGGSGIGLGVARQVARGHGGELVLLEPVLGRGARFLMRLG